MKAIYLSKENNVIQHLFSLRNSRNKRYRYNEFLIEGTVALKQASKQQWPIKSLFYNAQTNLSDWAKNYLSNYNTGTTYAVPETLMKKITDKNEDCSELIAIGETKFLDFSSYQPSTPAVVAVLDQPKSPGNLGMIIRSAKAFGCDAVVISGHAADEYDPKCIRSSVGTFFSMPIYRATSATKFLEKTTQLQLAHDVNIVTTGNKGNVDIKDMKFEKKLLFLVLGNETKGVSRGYNDIANQFVKITLPGSFTSLNIGAAASIFFYEIFQNQKKSNLDLLNNL